jgi:hypothetical protein
MIAVQEIESLRTLSEVTAGTSQRTIRAHLSLSTVGLSNLQKIFLHRQK